MDVGHYVHIMGLTEDVVVAHVWDIGADTTGTSLAQEGGFPWISSMTEGPFEGHAWRHD